MMIINNTNARYVFDSQTKDLLLERDFKYFLDLNFEANNYSEKEVELLNKSYRLYTDFFKKKLKEDKQFQQYIHGKTIRMFEGGGLPAHFYLGEQVYGTKIVNFESYGEMWAVFDLWKKHELKKRKNEKLWNTLIIKLGSLLGIILALIKFYETIF